MPPEASGPGSPADWLRHARSDLALARGRHDPEVLLETLCFHAQQAAEKAVKAILVSLGTTVPRTHSIRLLLDQLPRECQPPSEVFEAAILTDYAVLSRYPGDLEPVDNEEFLLAVQLAERTPDWAEAIIGRP